jgi:imidazolonepropionase-like amidohydrolase
MGKKVAVHVHGVEATRIAVEVGIDTLEHVPFRAHGGIEYDERIVDEIIRKGLIVSLAMPATWYACAPRRCARPACTRAISGRPAMRRSRRCTPAGAKLVVSSDSGLTGTRIDELALLIDELALLIEFLVKGVGLPAADVLHGATGLAGEVVGLAERVGTLEPGRLADLVVIDGDPLADLSAMQRIHTVIKDGEVVVREGGIVGGAHG